jgi:hypothetical protein
MARVKQSQKRMFGGINISQSVSVAIDSFPSTENVRSWEIVKALVSKHPEYGHNIARKLIDLSGPDEGRARSVSEWFEDLGRLFDNRKVDVLDGRRTILGLAHIDKDLSDFLASTGFSKALQDEISIPFESLLTGQADTIPENSTTSQPSAPAMPPDPAVLHSDSPFQEDMLGRKGFTEALAIWLTRFWQRNNELGENSFLMQLQGPWGAGKTTLLRLLEQALYHLDESAVLGAAPDVDPALSAQKAKSWIVVWFNAWQHQHVEPAWWPLYDRIFLDSVKWFEKHSNRSNYATHVKLFERSWRLRFWNRGYLTATVASLLALGGFLAWVLSSSAPGQSGSVLALGDAAKSLGAVIALAGSIWSGMMLLTRSLFLGSAGSAEAFVRCASDPLGQIREHFRQLVTKINRPLIVFVDDLDRCRPQYVVALLENIQTLFSHPRVFYAIAADKRWLYVCFENVYGEFAKNIHEPGRRLGFLFLEKAFQLSVSVPPLRDEVQKAYLEYLYRGGKSEVMLNIEKEREDAKNEFSGADSDDEIIAKLQTRTGNPIRDQARSEAAVKQSASAEIEIQTEFFLNRFAHLLEPNPRAMKRLVNAYGICRALALLSDVSLLESIEKKEQFVLWTIILLRWPSLAEFLEENPSNVDLIRGKNSVETVKADLRELVGKREVLDVLEGTGVKASLDEKAIRRIVSLKAQDDAPSITK